MRIDNLGPKWLFLHPMANTNLDQEIRNRIQGFVDELSALVKQAALVSVQEAFGSAPRRGPGRPRAVAVAKGRPAGAARGARGKRTSDQLESLATRFLGYVKSNPGQRLEQIGQGLKIHTKELKLPVAKLFEDKKISTKGKRRGTKYFAR